MPSERYFLENSFKIHDSQELKGSEYHHLAHVMRAQKGDAIELINGKGALAQAIVEDLKKDRAILKIAQVQQQPESPCRLILAQAIPKSNRLDLILEKGTELGVDSFWLFPGQYSVKKECFPNQLERARTVAISAMKQCGRLYLPSIEFRPPIEQWNLKESLAFFGDVDPKAPLFELIWKEKAASSFPIVFITGPEGGLSSAEEQFLRDQGAIGVKLHENILRTETASLMAMSLLSHWLLFQNHTLINQGSFGI